MNFFGELSDVIIAFMRGKNLIKKEKDSYKMFTSFWSISISPFLFWIIGMKDMSTPLWTIVFISLYISNGLIIIRRDLIDQFKKETITFKAFATFWSITITPCLFWAIGIIGMKNFLSIFTFVALNALVVLIRNLIDQ